MENNQKTGFIAGVGASAGGLESLEQFFRAMPPDTGLAFVVVQHLSPDHKSLMEELFTRFTSIPVREAKHHERVLPNHIYLLPPGKELEIADGRLEVTDRQQDRHLSFPIDRFLSSLAADCGQRAVAVILSGSGSDGSRGARRVQAQGGLVLVEDPESASFDGMPKAAIETGIVDVVMSAGGLARALVEHVTSGELPHGEAARVVEEVIALLRLRKRIDFDDYKRSTVYRRMLRRSRLANAQDLGDYLRLLEQDGDELAELHHDLLIGVTNFFRDEAGFNILARQIDELVRSPVEPDRELRAWVAACATGEEAFSVAIMFDDAIRKAGSRRGFKVFATDIHEGALEAAGAGIFSAERLKAMSEERLAAYFKQRPDGRYQVNPDVRHRIVFAKHNLLTDTPFTNLDLVTCRNMLIYLRPQAQRRALASLSYGLRIGGLLFLGSSESPGELQSCFDSVSEAAKVYRKRVHSRGMHRPEVPTRVSMRSPRESPRGRGENNLLPTYDALLERFMPQGFLVSDQRILLECFNGSEALLRVPSRRLSTDFLDLVPEEVRLAVSGVLARAARESGPVGYASIEWPAPGGAKHFALTAERLNAKNAEAAFLMTVAEQDAPKRSHTAVAEMPMGSERVLTLEDELTRTRENLQATVEELEASNEELQATNEEMVASNEELQSVNEELHSVNEELHTVNAEHQRKIAELSEVNRDTSHLLESIDVATLYLDGELRIRKYTPLAASIFSLVEHDTGRLLESFNHPLVYPAFMDDVRRVRDGEGRIEHEVHSRDGKWYLVRLLPYRVSDAIDGVVVTLTDATALAAARVRARQLSSIVDSSADAIIGQDLDGVIRSWNPGAERLYGYIADEIIGREASLLVPESERAEVADIFAKVERGGDVINGPARRRSKSGEILEIATTVSPVRDVAGSITGIACFDRDVRAQRELETRLRESERKFQDLYNNAPDMYMSLDMRSGRIVEHNATFRRVTGFSAAEVEAMHALDLFATEVQDEARLMLASMRAGEPVNDMALRIRRRDGSALDVTLSSTAVVDADGVAIRTRSIMRDVTERRLAEQKVLEAGAMREQFLAMVSHELRSPLHAVNAALQIIDSSNATDAQRTRAEGVVRRQTKQMVRLVDDLLDVSRITHGKLVLERSPVDLVEVARTALEAAASTFSEKGVLLLTEGLDQQMMTFGDSGRLAQVFTNLLQNAIRFTPAGRRVWLRAVREGQQARFEVADEGRGIEAADLESIFQMFVQSRQGLARTEGGLGLGLTIAERIVASHGGRIEATSPGPGRGATFTVTLSLDDRAITRPDGADGFASNLTIVVVEDQADAREALGMILELEGHKVASAGEGPEGLELILEQRPQVALLDLGLPGMNGFEIASRVREAIGHDITLIAMSGYGQPEDIRRSEAAGFDRHLTKPVDPRRLAGALRDLGWRGSIPQSGATQRPAGARASRPT
jgi:two-component system, chemotaxis family, CheB/CheR fusion protein